VAATLNGTAALATDPLFRQRVQAAMVTAALSVAAEAVGAQDAGTYGLRHELAVQVLNSPASFLDRFCWAAAANATVCGDVGPLLSIASSTAANPSVVTTAAAHGLASGDWVEIAGHAVNTAANGIWPVTVILTTTFSIPVLGNGIGTATGTAVKQPPDADIQFAVNSDFSDIAGVGVIT
jgi:hypothetical protein